mmetsp:Transcript_27644/g.81852  ORF Transcript_27644/g.81852 Transcript_27644/m.81852 type:complete len:107 (+) Transcript_27644:274-594(+)
METESPVEVETAEMAGWVSRMEGAVEGAVEVETAMGEGFGVVREEGCWAPALEAKEAAAMVMGAGVATVATAANLVVVAAAAEQESQFARPKGNCFRMCWTLRCHC